MIRDGDEGRARGCASADCDVALKNLLSFTISFSISLSIISHFLSIHVCIFTCKRKKYLRRHTLKRKNFKYIRKFTNDGTVTFHSNLIVASDIKVFYTRFRLLNFHVITLQP